MITIENLNKILAAQNLNIVLDSVVNFGNIPLYGMGHELYQTKRGGKYHLCFMGDGKRVYLKSVLKIVNGKKPYWRSINGQADRNTKCLAWFDDGRGPVVYGSDINWPMINNINNLLKENGEIIELDLPWQMVPNKGFEGECNFFTESTGSKKQVYVTIVGDGVNIKLKEVYRYSPIHTDPHFFLNYELDQMPVIV